MFYVVYSFVILYKSFPTYKLARDITICDTLF